MAANANTGKFYDQSCTTAFFTDIVDALEQFKTDASNHTAAQGEICGMADYQGGSADAQLYRCGFYCSKGGF